MKRAISIVLAASLAAVAAAQTAPSGASASASVRIAVIDVERLVRDSALGKEAFGRVKKLSDDKKSETTAAKELKTRAKLSTQGHSLPTTAGAAPTAVQLEMLDYNSFREATATSTAQNKSRDLDRRVFPIITHLGRSALPRSSPVPVGPVFADARRHHRDVLKGSHDRRRPAAASPKPRPARPVRRSRSAKSPVGPGTCPAAVHTGDGIRQYGPRNGSFLMYSPPA